MLADTFRQFNWFDILIVILVFRICYISVKNGFPIEFFKFLGTLLSIYISLHYYTVLSDLLRERFSTENMPLEFLDFVLFVGLAILTYMVFVILRTLFYRLIKMEAAQNLNKWGGLILGILRVYLIIGFLIFLLAISSIDYFRKSIMNSYSGSRLFRIAPQTYTWIWNNITSKFMTAEKFNKTISEVQDTFQKE